MRNKVFDNTSSKIFLNKSCPLSGKDAPIVDYKNINLLRRYMTEKGKILPSRVTQVSTKKQKELSAAIKRARFLALLPYVSRQ
jgi:small subunit ribosomal protein S18